MPDQSANLIQDLQDLHSNLIVASRKRLLLSSLAAALNDRSNLHTVSSWSALAPRLAPNRPTLLICTESLDDAEANEVLPAAKRQNSQLKTLLLLHQRSELIRCDLAASHSDAVVADEDLDLEERPLQQAIQAINQRRSYTSPSVRRWRNELEHSGIEPLTRRQQQVLQLIVDGCSNDAIAEALLISPSTAKSYSRDVLRKLGVPNRQQAVVLAMQLGVTPRQPGGANP